MTSLKFLYGCYLGFTIILIPILHKEDAEITTTLHELTWFGSSCFMVPIGSVLGGILAERIGTRLLAMITALLMLTAGLIFHWASSIVMILCAQALAGFACGLIKGTSFTYIAEVTQPYIRSTLMATISFSMQAGVFFTVMLGGYMQWRTVVLVIQSFLLVGLVTIFFIPESPYWLASNNRLREAQLSLAWFRGWTDPESIKTEFQSIANSLRKSSSLSINVQQKRKRKNLGRLSSFREMLKPYRHRSFYIPFLTICYTFFINDFGGTYVIKTFSMVVFQKLHSPIDVHSATAILSASRLLGSVSVIFTIHAAGKRNLIFFSLLGAGILFGLAATFGFLIDQKQLDSPVYKWIPVVAVIIATLMTAAGIEKVVNLLNSELYPIRLRQVSAGIGQLASTLIESTLNKAFLYMVNAFTVPGVFVIFLIIDFVGLITLYFILPETEGRTLEEIEEHYAGIRSLKNKSKGDRDMMAEKRVASNLLLEKA